GRALAPFRFFGARRRQKSPRGNKKNPNRLLSLGNLSPLARFFMHSPVVLRSFGCPPFQLFLNVVSVQSRFATSCHVVAMRRHPEDSNNAQPSLWFSKNSSGTSIARHVPGVPRAFDSPCCFNVGSHRVVSVGVQSLYIDEP